MNKTVYIIGAGIGGLSTAVRLLYHGYKVKIIEKDSSIGGITNIINSSEFSFDLSASIVMMPDKYIELFSYVNKDFKNYITLIPLDPIYKVFFKDGTTINISSKLPTMISTLESISSDDSCGYFDFLNKVYKKYLIADKNFLQKSHNKFFKFISFKNLSKIYKLHPLKTSYNYIAQHIQNEKIREILAFQAMYVGVSPFQSSNIYTLVPATSQIYGLYHIKGGMYSYVKALEKLINEFGGSIETNAEVIEIITENSKAVGIKTSKKSEYCDIIVCNADFPSTIKTLIKEQSLKGKYNDVSKLKYSCSTFILHLGLKKKYPILNLHNIYLGDNFKENIEAPFKGEIPKEPPYYIYCPSSIDDSVAKEGLETINVMMRVPNLTYDIQWFQENIKLLRDKIINDICKISGLEDIRENISFEAYTTPLDFKERFNTYAGCCFGLSHTLLQTNYFRPQALFKSIKNLYFVGASTHPGTGVSMVLTSGKLCTEEILKNNTLNEK